MFQVEGNPTPRALLCLTHDTELGQASVDVVNESAYLGIVACATYNADFGG
jgi:hypothetical protein